MTVKAETLGSVVVGFSGCDPKEDMHVGEMIGFADFPVATLRNEDGKQVTWAAHLCRVATYDETIAYWRECTARARNRAETAEEEVRLSKLDHGVLNCTSINNLQAGDFVARVGEVAFFVNGQSFREHDVEAMHNANRDLIDKNRELSADVTRLQRLLADEGRINRTLASWNDRLTAAFRPGGISSNVIEDMVGEVIDDDKCPCCSIDVSVDSFGEFHRPQWFGPTYADDFRDRSRESVRNLIRRLLSLPDVTKWRRVTIVPEPMLNHPNFARADFQFDAVNNTGWIAHKARKGDRIDPTGGFEFEVRDDGIYSRKLP